ncbi:putative Tapt1 family protein [Rosa chinensis]|uniref:Putative Tapt1 family protein n=1 Tax=Rosa chinensis TaxID=74649 RepID=A0A2P6RQS2_ROSCH|nr:putative Tapt1 family protein [Rosa chinensis]
MFLCISTAKSKGGDGSLIGNDSKRSMGPVFSTFVYEEGSENDFLRTRSGDYLYLGIVIVVVLCLVCENYKLHNWKADRVLGTNYVKFYTQYDLALCVQYLVELRVLVIWCLSAITLSSCIVAHNNDLFALLVSYNFAEIKSNVFKRYSKENIHSLVYFDSVERFHIYAFIIFILAQNILEETFDGKLF